jgi:vitamin B12/bleomycin/antimicrobial peptide transport system ATP-binding/permease protein
LRQPAYAVIDEATSALESDNEKLLYTLLTSLGTTVVSAGAPSLSKYHTQVLELAGDGTWKLFPSGDYKGKGWRLKILDILHIE